MIEISELLPDEYESLNLKSRLRLFRFSGEESKDLLFYEDLSLNSSQGTIVRQLLLASSKQSGLTLKSFISILETKGLKFTPETIRRIIGELKSRKILKESVISLHGKPLALPRCFEFCALSETLQEDDSRSLAKLKEQSKSDQIINNVQAQRNALAKRGLTLDDSKSDKNHHPTGVIFADGVILKEIQEISPPRANGSTNVARTFDNHNGNFHLEAKAPDQIATKGAIATLVVIINLAVAYNSKMLTQNRFEKPFQEKEIPIHIVDVLELRGIKDSGQARRRIREHVAWLRETIYRASELKGVFDKNLNKIFRQTDYQFFIQVTSNADEAPVLIDDKIKVSPNLYFITFNPIMEKELCEEDSFFSLPWSLMQASELLLFVYINFRRRQLMDEVVILDDLRKSMFYTPSVLTFQKKLEKELTDGGYKCDSGEADFNFCGYYIKKSVNQLGEHQYRVTCNKKEMITKSGGYYRQEIGDKNAPKILNPLRKWSDDKVTAGMMTASEIKESLNSQLLLAEFYKKYVIKTTVRNKQFRRIKIGIKEYTITYYDSKEVGSELAEIFSKEIGASVQSCFDLVTSVKAELHPIKYGSKEVTNDLFWEFVEFLSSRASGVITPVSVLEVARNYRVGKVSEWVNRNFYSLLEDFDL